MQVATIACPEDLFLPCLAFFALQMLSAFHHELFCVLAMMPIRWIHTATVAWHPRVHFLVPGGRNTVELCLSFQPLAFLGQGRFHRTVPPSNLEPSPPSKLELFPGYWIRTVRECASHYRLCFQPNLNRLMEQNLPPCLCSHSVCG
jgi:hypothetical protein